MSTTVEDAPTPDLAERVTALEGQLTSAVGSLTVRLQELEDHPGGDFIASAGGGGGGGAPTGPAGGSLAGEYPNPTLAAGSVGEAQLKGGAVTLAKLAAAVAARLVPEAGAEGNLLGWKAAGEAKWVAGGGGGGLTQVEIEALFLTTGLTKWPVESTSIGAGALTALTTGIHATAVGHNAAHVMTTGEQNTAVGWEALAHLTTAGFCTAIGDRALWFTTGEGNIGIGSTAGSSLTTGTENMAIGVETLHNQTTVSETLAIGNRALLANTTGEHNLAVGFNALVANTTGKGNLAVGTYALRTNTASNFNLAIGYRALFTSTGAENLAIGYEAMFNNTTGIANLAIGYLALNACTTGEKNTVLGVEAGKTLTTGIRNTLLGYSAGEKLTGEKNVFIGNLAGKELGAVNNKLLIANTSAENLIEGDFTAKTVTINGALSSTQTWTAVEALNAKAESLGAPYQANIEAAKLPGNEGGLRGALKAKEEILTKGILFTLPGAARPATQRSVIAGCTASNATAYQLVIKTTGEVEVIGAVKTGSPIALDGVTWPL